MKRIVTLFFLLCIMLASATAMADVDYLGNMEVINCEEWVAYLLGKI